MRMSVDKPCVYISPLRAAARVGHGSTTSLLSSSNSPPHLTKGSRFEPDVTLITGLSSVKSLEILLDENLLVVSKE